MTHLKRKLMMTLALLLTAATSAWATDYTTLAVGDVIKVGDTFTPTDDGAIYDWGVDNGVTYTLIRADVDNDYYVTEKTDGAYYVFKYVSIMSSPYIHFEKAFEVTAISDGLVVTNIETVKGGKLSYTLARHEPAATATTVALTWDATAKTATLTNGMPAGNVTVSVDYFPQAEFAKSTDATLAPTAIADVPANTDGAIVEAGTVAIIGTSEVKQGTLMYFVKQADGNTAPTAPTYDTEGWTEKVPTADGLQEGNAYVWYYIKGAEPDNIADRTDDNTRSDSDIMPLGSTGFVTLAAEPTYDVSLNKTGMADGEPALWSAKSTKVTTAVNLGEADLEGVKKGETVTVTYSGTKKIIGVKAEKKSAEKTITIGEQNYTVQKGETWKQFITRNQLSGWTIAQYTDTTWYVYKNKTSYKLRVSSDGINWVTLELTSEDAPIDTDKQYTFGYD